MSNETSEHKVNRAHWPPGPWNDEPDKVNWTTEAGLPGMIVRNNLGSLCGYVAVAKGHPLYGKGYGDGDLDRIDVHGGLTFAAGCSGAVCHTPDPGETDDVWWFGFDCAHCGDWSPPSFPPGLLGSDRSHPRTGEVYRDIAYVTAEVESLAAQLVGSP